MIIETMSLEEIAEIVRSDFQKELIRGYDSCFGMREKYGDYVMKHLSQHKYHYFGNREKITRNHNKYIFHFYSNGRLEYMRTGIIRNFWLEYLLKDGLHAVKVNPHNTKEITFFNPHFFDRYKERFLAKNYDVTDWTKRDVMEDYFLHNELSSGQPQNNPKYPNGIFLTNTEGVILGRKINNDIWEYRTYISFDMLKGTQITISQESSDSIEQLKYLVECHMIPLSAL